VSWWNELRVHDAKVRDGQRCDNVNRTNNNNSDNNNITDNDNNSCSNNDNNQHDNGSNRPSNCQISTAEVSHMLATDVRSQRNAFAVAGLRFSETLLPVLERRRDVVESVQARNV